jgi:hypothetical protein
MKPITLNENLNFVPLKIQMWFNDMELATGTAFFYEYKATTHFVTNWHNLSGRNPKTKQPLHSKGAIPNKLIITVPSRAERDGMPGVRWTNRVVSLYKDAAMLKSEYYTHPSYGENVDLATFPISGLEETLIVPANAKQLQLCDIRLRPSLDVFVLGFPLGMSGGASLPIWKRGSIATEPDIHIDDLPKFLIDTATRQGMSGSPVYAQETGLFFADGKTDMKDALIGTGRRFAGIYSGRLGDDTFQAQLGIVWKIAAIEETIEHSLRKQ